MFDLAFSELFVIAIVALIVLGPERLPKVGRFAGLWMRRARAQWYSVKSEFENELADEELKRSLRQVRDDLRAARDSVLQSGHEMQLEFAGIGAVAHGQDEPLASDGAAEDTAGEAAADESLGTHNIEKTSERSHANDETARDARAERDAQR